MKYKNIKKFLSFALALTIITVLSMPAYAYSAGKEKIFSINEWDEYQRVVSMSDNELLEAGYTKEDITQIRNFNYEEEIKKRAALDDETLKAYRYTDHEIKELREAAEMEKIPESVMRSISSSTMTSELKYQGNGSYVAGGSTMYYVDMKYSWSWSRIPYFTLMDMVAIAYNSSVSNQFIYTSVSGYNLRCHFQPLSSMDSAISQVKNWTYSTSKPNYISAKFAIGYYDDSGALTHFVYSGYGFFRLTNRSNNAQLYVDAAYGHATISINPSYSVSVSGASIGLSFSSGVDEQHCTGWFYEDFTITRNRIYYGVVYGKNNTGGTPSN